MGARTTIAEMPVEESPSGHDEARLESDAARAVSFERLADQSLDSSYRLARVILGDRAEAEDAVHDAIITAWGKWTSLRDVDRFEAWFHRIVVNTCRNRLTKRTRRREEELVVSRVPIAPDAIGGVHERELMSRAFAQLEPDHRIVLTLRYYHDLTVDDIARLLGVRSGTIKSRLHRAQGRMRQILEAQGNTR